MRGPASTPIKGEESLDDVIPTVIVHNVFTESVTNEQVKRSTALAVALSTAYQTPVYVLADVKPDLRLDAGLMGMLLNNKDVKDLMSNKNKATSGQAREVLLG